VNLVIICCKARKNGLFAGELPVHKGNKKIRLFDHEDYSNERFAALERE